MAVELCQHEQGDRLISSLAVMSEGAGGDGVANMGDYERRSGRAPKTVGGVGA